MAVIARTELGSHIGAMLRSNSHRHKRCYIDGRALRQTNAHATGGHISKSPLRAGDLTRVGTGLAEAVTGSEAPTFRTR